MILSEKEKKGIFKKENFDKIEKLVHKEVYENTISKIHCYKNYKHAAEYAKSRIEELKKNNAEYSSLVLSSKYISYFCSKSQKFSTRKIMQFSEIFTEGGKK